MTTPATRPATTHGLLLVGMASNISLPTLVWVVVVSTSTTGVEPVTVRLSWSEPTCRSASTLAFCATCTRTPSRFSVTKPESSKVTM